MNRVVRVWTALRALLAFSIFAIGASIFRLFVIPIVFVCSLSDRQRASKRVRRIVRFLLGVFLFVLRALGLVRVRYHGSEWASARGTVVLSNHPSLLDVVVLVAALPDTVCVAKSSLFDVPIFGAIIRAAGYLPNDLLDRLLTEGTAALSSGRSILIFPEGTRTEPGSALNPFNSTGVGLAIRAQSSITPVVLRCSAPCFVKGQGVWELDNSPFEFDATLCDPRAPVAVGAGIAEERAARAEEARSVYSFFVHKLNDDGTLAGTG